MLKLIALAVSLVGSLVCSHLVASLVVQGDPASAERAHQAARTGEEARRLAKLVPKKLRLPSIPADNGWSDFLEAAKEVHSQIHLVAKAFGPPFKRNLTLGQATFILNAMKAYRPAFKLMDKAGRKSVITRPDEQGVAPPDAEWSIPLFSKLKELIKVRLLYIKALVRANRAGEAIGPLISCYQISRKLESGSRTTSEHLVSFRVRRYVARCPEFGKKPRRFCSGHRPPRRRTAAKRSRA